MNPDRLSRLVERERSRSPSPEALTLADAVQADGGER